MHKERVGRKTPAIFLVVAACLLAPVVAAEKNDEACCPSSALVVWDGHPARLVADSGETIKKLPPALGTTNDIEVNLDLLCSINSSLRPELFAGSPGLVNTLLLVFLAVFPIGTAVVLYSKPGLLLMVVLLEVFVLLAALPVYLLPEMFGLETGENENISARPDDLAVTAAGGEFVLFVASPQQAASAGYRCGAADVFRKRPSGTGRFFFEGTSEDFIIGSPDAAEYIRDGWVLAKLVARGDTLKFSPEFHEPSPCRSEVYTESGISDSLAIRLLAGGIITVILAMLLLKRGKKPPVLAAAAVLATAVVFGLNSLWFYIGSDRVPDDQTVSVSRAVERLDYLAERLSELLCKMSGNEFRMFRETGWKGLPGILSPDDLTIDDAGPLNPYTGLRMKCGTAPGDYYVRVEPGPGSGDIEHTWLCTYDMDGRERRMKVPGRSGFIDIDEFDQIFHGLEEKHGDGGVGMVPGG